MQFLRKLFGLRALKSLPLMTGSIFTAFMAGLFIFQPQFLRVIELNVFDAVFRLSYDGKVNESVIIVDLDEASLSEFGQWPWPRYRVALMLEKIRRDGAASIALDMVFAELDRTSPYIIQQQLEDELGVSMSFSNLPQGLEDNDQILANILEGGPFTLGFYFDLVRDHVLQPVSNNRAHIHPLRIATVSEPGAPPLSDSLFHAAGITGNIDILSKAVDSSGFMNVAADPDGIIRRVPLLMSYDDNYYPSLALAALLNALGLNQAAVRSSAGGVESIRIGAQTIPLDSRGQLLLNYRGPGKSFPYVSASDILSDRTSQGLFQDKIVFIGTSAAGLKDIRSTPLDNVFPGVEAHATVVDNILTGDFLHRPDWALGTELILILAAGIASTIIIIWLSGLWLVLPLMLCAAGLWFGTMYLFQSQGIYFSPFMPLLTLAGNFSLLTFQNFWIEEKEKRKLQNTFEHYLSPDVVKRVVKNPSLLKLGGDKKNLSILFTDIRSFTNISEAMEPEELVNFMNDYLTAMTEVILKNKGTLDKYMGDAIMAFFGAPEDMPDHARVAQKTAIEMLDRLHECQEKWCIPGQSSIEIGVGISSGEVIVGNMGSAKRFDYTVMGDQVNLASRLEGLTKMYGVKILVSEFTRNQARDDFAYRELDLVRVKGKQKPVAVFEPFRNYHFTQEELAFIAPFEQGLAAYRSQKWEQAISEFQKALTLKPQDYPCLKYIDRCRQMAKSPPGPDWDGVWVMQTK